jgi:hypothetical protein
VRLVAAICLVLGGCEGGPPLAEIGTGTSHFEPLEDRQSVPLIAGAQGGWHLWIAVRARGVDPSGVRVDVVSYPREAERPRQTTFHTLELVPHDGWFERAGLVQVLSTPECFHDREVVVSIDLIDHAERAAHDERVVVPHAGMSIGACAP